MKDPDPQIGNGKESRHVYLMLCSHGFGGSVGEIEFRWHSINKCGMCWTICLVLPWEVEALVGLQSRAVAHKKGFSLIFCGLFTIWISSPEKAVLLLHVMGIYGEAYRTK